STLFTYTTLFRSHRRIARSRVVPAGVGKGACGEARSPAGVGKGACGEARSPGGARQRNVCERAAGRGTRPPRRCTQPRRRARTPKGVRWRVEVFGKGDVYGGKDRRTRVRADRVGVRPGAGAVGRRRGRSL